MALKLQRPLPDEALGIVAKGERRTALPPSRASTLWIGMDARFPSPAGEGRGEGFARSAPSAWARNPHPAGP
jgi:hypothetical protein